MKPGFRSTRRRLVATATLLSTLGTASLAAAQADPTDDELCAGFVYLDRGKFEVDDTPYELKGANFQLTIAGKLRPGGVDPPYEYFLAPSNGNRPDINAICGQPSDPSCCDGATSCAASLQTDIDALRSADFNSVRLLFRVEWDNHRPRHGVFRVNEGEWPLTHWLYLDDATDREIALDLIEQQINWLGSEGLRTILLTGSFDHGDADSQLPYIEWLENLSARLVDNPYLIAYDPQNEPVYEDHHEAGKARANTLSQGWFDALTTNDPRHLVTVGIGDAGSVFTWDPQVVWDHFSSYHIYPPIPWDGEVHGSNSVANDIYYASLNACGGDPCPFGGDYDGANCLQATGPAGTTGSIGPGTFLYTPVSGNNPCPIGQSTANGCLVGQWVSLRDDPFTLAQTLYYVDDQNGACPPGAQFDGANCIVYQSPPGVTPFIWTDPDGQTGYYYNWMSPSQHCQSPAWDDSAHCKLGDVPAGWSSPFYLQRPLFYTVAANCGPRKPVHLGETGFTVMPYPGGSKDFWTSPPSFIPPGLQVMKTRCDAASDGPIVDSISVGGVVYEAEDGVITAPAQEVPCPGCRGTGVSILAGGDVTVTPTAQGDGCVEVVINYTSPRPTKLQISVNGKPPRWIDLPVSVSRTLECDFSFSPGDSIRLGATERIHGDFDEQIEFLAGGNGWDGMFPYSHACGFQGMHWWMYGSDAYFNSTCGDYGLNAYWYQVESRSENYPDELLFRPVMETLRDQVDYLAPAGSCAKPAGFHASLHPEVSATPRYVYHGRVIVGNGGLPYAAVQGYFEECGPWTGLIKTFTDETGAFTLQSDHPIADVRASHFGYSVATVYGSDVTPGPNAQLPDIELTQVNSLIVDHTSLHVPSTPGRACWASGSWVVQ